MDNAKQKQSEITEAEKHLISELQDGKNPVRKAVG